MPVLVTSSVIDDSPDEVGEWIPTRGEIIEIDEKISSNGLNRLRTRRHPGSTFDPLYTVHDIFPTTRKICPRTFLEGRFDDILLHACSQGDVPVVSYLLPMYVQYFSIDRLIGRRYDRGRLHELSYDKLSLLHAAAESLEVDVIEVLLSAGANVNVQTGWSITPLISALFVTRLEGVRCTRTVACLLDAGANVNCRDADGLTPLMYAARYEDCMDAVPMLIEAGANPYAMDNEGCTALHHSCIWGNAQRVLLSIC